MKLTNLILSILICGSLYGQTMYPTYSVFNPQTSTIMNNIPSPLQGGLVYNTTDECYYFYKASSSSWVSLCDNSLPNSSGDNIYTVDGSLTSDRLLTADAFDLDYVFTAGKQTFRKVDGTSNEATVCIIREFPGVQNTARPATLELYNPGETTGGLDYQNEAYLILRAGSTSNHRRYIGFHDFNNSVSWLTGANGGNTWIQYDSKSAVHRFWFENTVTGNGNTDIASAGTGKIRLNNASAGAEPNRGEGVHYWGDLVQFEGLNFSSDEKSAIRDDGVYELYNLSANPPAPIYTTHGICVVNGVYKKWDGTAWVNL